MKNVILTLTMILLCSGIAQARDVQFSFWGLTEQSFSQSNNAVIGRAGIQYENMELFLSSTWWPSFNEEGDLRPPQVYGLGACYHFPDLIDANSPVPWIPEALMSFIPEAFLARPYIGGQATVNFDEDSGYAGLLAGLQIKANENDKTALITEAQFLNTFNELAAVPDDWRLVVGFRIEF